MGLRSLVADLPEWMRQGDGMKLAQLFALSFDALIDWARHGIRARFPEYGSDETLAAIGRDRGLPRGAYEPKAAYQARLQGWLDSAEYLGNPFQIMRDIQAYLAPYSPRLRIVNDGGSWYTLNADGSVEWMLAQGNWDWDSETTLLPGQNWSRFWVIIYSTLGPWEQAPIWGDPELWGGEWDHAEVTFGSTARIGEIDTIRAMIDAQKPPYARCESIIVAFDDDAWDPENAQPPNPDGWYANASRVSGGVRVETRPANSEYWPGTGGPVFTGL